MEDKELNEMIERINKRVTIEVSALTIEQISNNLIIIADTLEKTIDVVKTLRANDIEIQEQIIELGDKVEILENDMEVLL